MGDRLIAEYDHVGGRFLYYTPDQINTTRVVTDQGGNVVYSVVHDPYGGIQQSSPNNTYDPQLKFSGKEHDEESQLDYFGARYYDRNQYRFVSVDAKRPSILNLRKWNLYSYCGNNPLVFIDPDGNSYLVFYAQRQQIELYDSSNNLVGRWDAANNVVAGYHNFPEGDFPRCWWRPGGGPGTERGTSFGPYGGIVFNVNGDKGDDGLMVHSGREDEGGYLHPTLGCIRTEDEAMEAMRSLERSDPVLMITVIHEELIQTELPAPNNSLIGMEPPGIPI